MTREELARTIRWPRIIWLAGLVNVVAMLPQLVTILRTWDVTNLSLGMFVTYFTIQVLFSLHGFFNRDRMLLWCLGLSAVVSSVIIGLILGIRAEMGRASLLYVVIALVIALLMLVSAVDYVRRAWQGETNPVPATWILMMVMMGLSFWMYWVSPSKSWTANLGVTAGVVNIAIILLGVVAFHVYNGTLYVAFDAVQKSCLALGGAVVVFWAISDNPLHSYSMVQGIAVIAYIATVVRLWKSEKSTEPYFLWGVVFLANLLAIYPAFVRDDPFAKIYLVRAVPSTLFVIFLIARVKRRMKRKQLA